VKTVYLTSGPRGSGKSIYIKKIVACYPKIVVISRDDVLIELFGSTSLDPYGGGHYIAKKVLFEKIEKYLSSHNDLDIILDYWNGFSRERVAIIEKLRGLGADRVICWQFFVPVDVCLKWFFSKPDSKGYGEFGIRRDHALYYKKAECIEDDGFDGIRHIDPRQLFF
jgi:hypothetical protein